MCIKKKKSISFLLGAGFSKQAGYYIADELSNKILCCEKEGLYMDSSGSVCNIAGNIVAKNPYFDFLMRLQKVYHTCHNNFNYEAFYDFIKSEHSENCCFLKELSNAVGIKGGETSISNTFEQIDDIYNQIVAYYLNKEPNITKYSNFKIVVSSLETDYVVNVHTLNHDLLFEKLFWGEYSDGFSYDMTFNYCEQPIRILKYNGEYHCKNKIALYKLHGSIDYYTMHNVHSETNVIKNANTPDYIKIPDNINRSCLKGENGEFINNLYPAFLTGINFKRTRYKENFYNDLHSKFISNLASADKLIIIGYSGNDEGINKHIRKKLDKKASCFVIDKDQNEAQNVIGRIWSCRKKKNCYAVKNILDNVEKSDFEETTYRN